MQCILMSRLDSLAVIWEYEFELYIKSYINIKTFKNKNDRLLYLR